jgi:hypothetical protein
MTDVRRQTTEDGQFEFASFKYLQAARCQLPAGNLLYTEN